MDYGKKYYNQNMRIKWSWINKLSVIMNRFGRKILRNCLNVGVTKDG